MNGTESPAAAWSARADELAAFFLRRMANRTDRFVEYLPADQRQHSTVKAVRVELDQARLVRHFRPEGKQDIVVLYALSPALTCKWAASDIDAHPGKPANPEGNLRVAKAAYDRLTAAGWTVLLVKSNGIGGYHLIVFFDAPVPAADARAWMRDVICDWHEHGLEDPPEVFPKSATFVGKDGVGTGLRVAGWHHTRDYWTEVWDGEQWLSGEEAVRAVLALEKNLNPASRVPHVPPPPPPPPYVPRPTRRGELMSNEEVAREALKYISPNVDYDTWLKVGFALHQLGDGLLPVWVDWSRGGSTWKQGECEKKWKSFTRGGPVKMGTLITIARQTQPDFLTKGSRKKDRMQTPAPRKPAANPAAPNLIDRLKAGSVDDVYAAAGELATLEPAAYRTIRLGIKWAHKDLDEQRLDDAVQAARQQAAPAAPPTPPTDDVPQVDHAAILAEAKESKDLQKLTSLFSWFATLTPEKFIVIKAGLKGFPGLSQNDLVSGVNEHRKRIERERAAAEPPAGLVDDPEDKRPIVKITTNEHDVACKTIDKLKADDAIFKRGTILVRVLDERDPDDDSGIKRSAASPTIGVLPPASLRERMTKYARFTQMVKIEDEWVECDTHPTSWLVNAIDQRAGDWPGIRRLNGISDIPILRPDGTIWQTRGYDPKTGVVYRPRGKFPTVPDDVTIDDADAAVDYILDIVCNFKFQSPEHKAAWLAGFITAHVRFAFDGPSPLFMFDANDAGAGKSLLVQIIGESALGGQMPTDGYTRDEEEMRKKITSLALSGDTTFHLDNVTGEFGDGTIDRALTSTMWADRLLATNKNVKLPLNATWFATGNNVSIAGDTTRRTVYCRLEMMKDRTRDNGEDEPFKYPKLIEHVRSVRPKVVAAALTVVKAYINAGRPKQKFKPMPSFEGWSDLVPSALVWVGQPDPCLTRARLAETSDTSRANLAELIAAWREYNLGNGVVISELLERLYPAERRYAPTGADAVRMRAAIEQFIGAPAGKTPSARLVANKLKLFRKRVIGVEYLDIDGSQNNRAGAVWRLRRTDNGAVGETQRLSEDGESQASLSAEVEEYEDVV